MLGVIPHSTNPITNTNPNCGWPSFDRSIKSSIEYDTDYKLGYPRTELKCSKCGGHLGHVFNDGPKIPLEKDIVLILLHLNLSLMKRKNNYP